MEDLLLLWPGNDEAVRTLWGFAASGRGPQVPILVYGSPGNGKTTLVLEVLRRARCGVAYVDGAACMSHRQLYESVLAQLCAVADCDGAHKASLHGGEELDHRNASPMLLAMRDAADARAAYPLVKCERSSDFARSCHSLLARHRRGGVWVVVDRADAVASAAPEAFPTLLRLPALGATPLGVVLVSTGPLRRMCGAHSPGAPVLVPVRPPATDEAMVDALRRWAPTDADTLLYSVVARRLTEALRPAVRSARDASWLCRRVYAAVCAAAGAAPPAGEAPAARDRWRRAGLGRVNGLIMGLRKDLHGRGDVRLGWSGPTGEAGEQGSALVGAARVRCAPGARADADAPTLPAGADGVRAGPADASGAGVALSEVDLPLVTKFALLACFLCSYVAPDRDTQLFTRDATGRRRRTRKRARGQGKAAVPARLLGPRPFPLERAHAVLTSLLAEHEDGVSARRAAGALMASHVATLEQLGMVARPGGSTVSGAVALEQPKLLCTAPHATVMALADQLRPRGQSTGERVARIATPQPWWRSWPRLDAGCVVAIPKKADGLRAICAGTALAGGRGGEGPEIR